MPPDDVSCDEEDIPLSLLSATAPLATLPLATSPLQLSSDASHPSPKLFDAVAALPPSPDHRDIDGASR